MSLVSVFLLHGLAIAAPDPGADATAKILEGMELSVELTLVEAGAEPRQVLRYRPKPGSKVDLEMVNTQQMKMEMIGPDGTAMPMPGMGDLSPTMIMGMHQEVGQPVDNGMIPVTVGYTEMSVTGVPDEMKGAMLAGMKPLEGTSFRMLVDQKTGKITQIDVDSDTSDELYGALQSMADGFSRNMAQFPDEPVGVGAKWTIDLDMNMAGMQLGATNHMTVTKIQGDRVEMAFDMVMNKGDSKMDFPGMPPGAEVDFTRFEASGSGTHVIDLATMATLSTSKTDMDLAMKVAAEGQNMGMNMKMNQKSEIRPKQ